MLKSERKFIYFLRFLCCFFKEGSVSALMMTSCYTSPCQHSRFQSKLFWNSVHTHALSLEKNPKQQQSQTPGSISKSLILRVALQKSFRKGFSHCDHLCRHVPMIWEAEVFLYNASMALVAEGSASLHFSASLSL